VAVVAAALIERCAAEAGSESARGRAKAARIALAELIDADAAALATLMRGLDPGGETAALASEAASAPALRLRRIAGELAGLAEQIGRDGRPLLRGEALCAHVFASAAARAADEIVAINERASGPVSAPGGDGANAPAGPLEPLPQTTS
jgi:hypothetical protein